MTDIDQTLSTAGKKWHKSLPGVLGASTMFLGKQRKSEVRLTGFLGESFLLTGVVDYLYASVSGYNDNRAHVVEGKMRGSRVPVDSLQALCYAFLLRRDPTLRYFECVLSFYYGSSNLIVPFSLSSFQLEGIEPDLERVAELSLAKQRRLQERRDTNNKRALVNLQEKLDSNFKAIVDFGEPAFGTPAKL